MRKACVAIASLACCALLPNVLALDTTKSIFQYNSHTWTRQNGLPASGINAIAETKDGFIWLGTPKGLVRHDGVEFKTVTLPSVRLLQHQGISALSATDDGDLWFGIPNGGFGVYRHDGVFATLTNEPWVTPDMNTLAVLSAKDGSLWVSSGSATVRWTTNSNTAQSFDFAHSECQTIFEDSKGRIWISMLGTGVFYYDGTRMVPFPDPALKEQNIFVYGIAEDPDGNIWFGTQYGTRVYDRDFHLQPSPGLSKIVCLLKDREGTLWLGSDGDGLFCWRHGQASNFRKVDGLADDHVRALCEDREGNLWIGTRGGLNLLSDVKFPLYAPEHEVQSTSFHSICPAADGGLWAGTSAGLFRFDGTNFTEYGTNFGFNVLWMKQVFEASDGDVYVADANQEIQIFRDGKIVAHYKCPNWQNGFTEDRQGVVVAVGTGLFHANRSGLTPFVFTNPAPPIGWIRSINSTRDGTVLVASVSGIFRVKDGKWDRFSTDNGLPANEALWISEDSEGVLWAGTAGGVARIQGARIDSWNQDNGLFDNYIRAVVEDDHGWMWFHSAGGIFRVRRDRFLINNDKSPHLDCEAFDGMDSVKTIGTADVEFSACKTRDGRIWIPSPEGIILVDPAQVRANVNLPSVHMEKIRINGKEWSPTSALAVDPGRGELEIQYTAPSFADPGSQRFRYKLEGYESNWEMVGARRSAFFTNLKPGKYKFVVETCTDDGSRGGEPASFQVELLPFFYQTAWFYIMCGALTFSALLGLYTWRVRFLTLRQREMQATQARLETEVQHRTAELSERNVLLEKEIDDRKQAQQEVERTHRKLLEASRLAGMGEVATSVLHNVGNVLNSVNVSTSVLTERIRKSKVASVARVADLMKAHQADLGVFLSNDSKGRQLPSFLEELSVELNGEQSGALKELASLHKHVEHIKQIVSMQQSHAKLSGVTTTENIVDLVEDTLRMNVSSLDRHPALLKRDYQASMPKISVDRHKVIQILLNLIQNAKHACEASDRQDKHITISIRHHGGQLSISVADNGVGIPPENLDRIFNHGFTTKKDGHGFGLHSGALAAKEMGGKLRAISEGTGKGAEFILELPARSPTPAVLAANGF